MSKLSTVVAFIAGAAVGCIVSWGYNKAKYEKRAKEEIEMKQEVIDRREARIEENRIKAEAAIQKPDLTEYNAKLRKEGYTNYSTSSNSLNDRVGPNDSGIPYVISPEQFGENEEYDTLSLTYYADGVLTDSQDDPITFDEVESIVGPDALKSFGEYEDDSVFVRDDELKNDYEILLDGRNYADVLKTKPHQIEQTEED